MSYYEGINQGDYYLCDRCEVAKLRADEFNDNIRAIEGSNDFMRYCDECRNYLTLQTWTDKQGNFHSVRSERIING
jgi:hypothetical protein